MTASERAQRVRIDCRLAIMEDLAALNRQRKAAVQADNADAVARLQATIDTLNDRLDDLSMISVEALEDSEAVRTAIRDLRAAADDLEDAAATITDIALALEKGAAIVDKATEVVTKLRALVPA